MKKLALISVTDKAGVAEFAKGLEAKGFEILSTGGTAEYLRAHGADVINISYYTGMPEVLGGRVKTLHPKIHAGILAKPSDEKHCEEMEELNIRRIEVVAVNLYPFEQTVLSNAEADEAIENIDIGGPAMLRAAAKNAQNVFVIVDPEDYPNVLANLDNGSDELRRRLQAKAFSHTSFYDSLIAEYLSKFLPKFAQDSLTLGMRLNQRLRYGENPHQRAALYSRPFEKGGIPHAHQLWGKELSYNNILDADAAWELARELSNACVIVKHGNPCGASWVADPVERVALARQADPISAFGGIVAMTGELSEEVATAMCEKGNFFEVIIAQSITPAALNVFKSRSGWGQDVRILAMSDADSPPFLSVRTIRGGALVQEADVEDPAEWQCVTKSCPDESLNSTLQAAWRIVKHVKSNGIVIANDKRLLGVGAGQMNRVQSVRLALEAAGDCVSGSVLASDAFFPFPDSIEVAAEAGVAAVVQPGGSKKDADVIKAADKHGLSMLFTGIRHFRH